MPCPCCPRWSSTPRRLFRLPLALVLVAWMAGSVPADVVVSSLVGGPVGGDGGTFTVKTSGTISSASDGIVADSSNGITELYALGVVEAFATGFVNGAGNAATLASVTGTIGGGNTGAHNSGSIGYFQVSTGIIRGADAPGLVNSGSIGLLQVMEAGRIAGSVTDGVRNTAAGGIGTLQNFGLLTGLAGVATSGTIGNLSNEVGGGIAGTGYGILVSGGGVAALSNAGSITGPDALVAAGTIGNLANAATGAITGDFRGVRIETTGAVGSFDNAGTISATAGTALQLDFGATLDSFHNTGTVTSTEGMVSAANLAMLVNEGRLAGTGNRGLGLISGTAGTVLNTGTISGLVTGVVSSVSLDRISNDARGSLISGGWRGVQFDDPTKIVEVLNNVGKIEGSDGIENRGRINNVVNSGEILGTGESGMSNGSASLVGFLLNSHESVIQGAIVGFGTSGTAVHLVNDGTVQGTTGDGITVASTGMMSWLENRSSGTLVGGHRGVSNHGILDEFTNEGVVTSPGESGLFSAPGSTLGILTNTGTIHADFYGILAYGISGTITNSGIVSATTYHGFAMNGGGAKLDTLANSGTISGGQRGVLVDVDATLSTFDSSGLVTTPGEWGVFVADKARLLTLTNSGRIASATDGIGIVGTSGTIANSGKIIAGSGRGLLVDGGQVTEINSTGTIAGNAASGAGVEVTATGSVATFINRGLVTGDRAVVVTGSATVALLSNTGTLAGATVGLAGTGGRVTALVNDQTGRIVGDASAGIDGGDYDTIDNFGSIAGPVGVFSTGSIGTFTNRATGDIVATGTGNSGFRNLGPVTTFVNEAGGRIEGASSILFEGAVTSATNAGEIVSTASLLPAIAISAPVGTLLNSGTVAGDFGIAPFTRGSIGTLENTATGAIDATRNAITVGGGVIGRVVNAGRIAGGHHGVVSDPAAVALTNLPGGTITGTMFAGVRLTGGASMLVNEAGAVIESLGGAGVEYGYGSGGITYVSGTLANAGVIRGDEAGVFLRAVFSHGPPSALRKLVNTGTLVATGTGGPALLIESGATFGDPSGAEPALTSTGPGASIGRIENSGTIHGGFRIENQDVVVTATGSPGVFRNGLLDVRDGNLTFGAGEITLGADVEVGGGAGTFSTEGTLRLLGIQNVAGGFKQLAGSTVLMELLGTAPGDYGRLDITGSADFSGGLALDTTMLPGGLDNGQIFELFRFGSSTGGFGSLAVNGTSLPSLAAGLWSYGSLLLSETWTATTMSLEVIRSSEKPVPEIDPAGMGSVLALVFGSLGLAERRLRRGRRAGVVAMPCAVPGGRFRSRRSPRSRPCRPAR
ncbi:MAG: hypothetical protein EBR86_13245 [Planctomycetia bacterium]|nr:hypothetical protein [Planctomycetia bacterium]